MPRFRRQGFGRSGTAPKRQIGNAAVSAEIDGLTTTIGIAKAVYSFGLLVTVDALTIVRTRGQFGVRVAAASSGNSIIRGVLGLIVVSSDAFAAGIGSLPGPLSDSGNDWFVWAPFTLLFDDVIANNDSKYVTAVDFDSRGMRKMKFGQEIALILEVESDLAGSAIDSAVALRTQFKL